MLVALTIFAAGIPVTRNSNDVQPPKHADHRGLKVNGAQCSDWNYSVRICVGVCTTVPLLRLSKRYAHLPSDVMFPFSPPYTTNYSLSNRIKYSSVINFIDHQRGKFYFMHNSELQKIVGPEESSFLTCVKVFIIDMCVNSINYKEELNGGEVWAWIIVKRSTMHNEWAKQNFTLATENGN